MSAKLKYKIDQDYFSDTYNNNYFQENSSIERSVSKVWTFNFNQIMAIWCAAAGVLLFAFLSGLYAGRVQGKDAALQNQPESLDRLPIISRSIVSNLDVTTPSIAQANAQNEVKNNIIDSSASSGALIELKEKTLESNIADLKSIQRIPVGDGRISNQKNIANVDQAPVIGNTIGSRFADDREMQNNISPKNQDLNSNQGSLSKVKENQVIRFDEKTSLNGVADNKRDPLQANNQESLVGVPAVKEAISKIESPTNLSKKKTAMPFAQEGSQNNIKPEANIKTVEKTVGKNMVLQVASSQSSNEANKILKSLNSSGVNGKVEAVKVSGKTYYRVVTQPLSSEKQVQYALKKIKSNMKLKSEPFLKNN